LRQGLSSEARPAGAENHNVGCPLCKLTRSIAYRVQIVARFRKAQQRQTVVAMTRTQPLERTFCPPQHGFEGGPANAVRPDALFAGAIDCLVKTHAGICLESRERRNLGKQRRA
jgi:hypothetical protein